MGELKRDTEDGALGRTWSSVSVKENGTMFDFSSNQFFFAGGTYLGDIGYENVKVSGQLELPLEGCV